MSLSRDVFGRHVDWAARAMDMAEGSTSQRNVRFADGSFQAIRVPDAVLRVSKRENPSLIQALNSVANQWDFLFP